VLWLSALVSPHWHVSGQLASHSFD